MSIWVVWASEENAPVLWEAGRKVLGLPSQADLLDKEPCRKLVASIPQEEAPFCIIPWRVLYALQPSGELLPGRIEYGGIRRRFTVDMSWWTEKGELKLLSLLFRLPREDAHALADEAQSKGAEVLLHPASEPLDLLC